MFEVIPNIYTAARGFDTESKLGQILPRATTNTLAQIAYRLNEIKKYNDQDLARKKERKIYKIISRVPSSQKRKGTKKVHYKFAVENTIGILLTGVVNTVREMNLPISQALGIPNYTSRSPNAMTEIQANDLVDGLQTITRTVNGFQQPIYINKFYLLV